MDNTENSHITIMEWQPWTLQTNCRLLRRFQDELLQPPPPVSQVQHAGVVSSSTSETSPVTESISVMQRLFTSAKNIFGLFRQYLPPHMNWTSTSQLMIFPTTPCHKRHTKKLQPTTIPTPIEVCSFLEIGFGMAESLNPRPTSIPSQTSLAIPIFIKTTFITSTGIISTMNLVLKMLINGLMAMQAGPLHLYQSQFHFSPIEMCSLPQTHALKTIWPESFITTN